MKSTMVGFRLSREVWTRYVAAAEAQGVSLATYLRGRLEQQDQLQEHQRQLERTLTALHRAVEHSASARPAPPAQSQATPPAILVEMLLLLRSLAGPQTATVAQKEVERRGLKSWS
jgi:hypothetical protein